MFQVNLPRFSSPLYSLNLLSCSRRLLGDLFHGHGHRYPVFVIFCTNSTVVDFCSCFFTLLMQLFHFFCLLPSIFLQMHLNRFFAPLLYTLRSFSLCFSYTKYNTIYSYNPTYKPKHIFTSKI